MGQGGVGKTALVTRFNRDEFLEGVSVLLLGIGAGMLN